MDLFHLEPPGDEAGPVTDWSAFPQGYGVLLNERLIFPEDLSLWRMKIDRTRQLFVDDYLIAHRENLRREFHPPQDHPANPLLRDAWPRYVCPDPDHGYRMYYNRSGWLVYVAYSADGLHWERPELDVYDHSHEPERFPGGPNNVVASGEIHGLFYEPQDPDPQQRWKAILRRREGAKDILWPYFQQSQDPPLKQAPYALFTSPDGLNWSFKADTSILKAPASFQAPDERPVGIGDCLLVRWDPKLNTYIANTKHTIGPDFRMTPVFHSARVVAVCESDDLIHWSPPRIYAYPDGEDAKLPGMYGIYEADGFPYESLWLNCFSMTAYLPANREERKKLMPTRPYRKRNWIRLAGSRDGRHWYYLGDRRPFIALGAEDSWKPHYLRMAQLRTVGGPVVRDDELWFYYRGTNLDGPKDTWHWAGGVAILRRDGFASLNAGEEPGMVITRPLVFEGEGELYVNANVPSNGTLRASVLTEDGEPLEGFAAGDCPPLCEDSTRHRLGWRQNETLGRLKDRYIRLAFHLQNSQLYAFWIE